MSSIDLAIVENVRLLTIKNLEDIHNRFVEYRGTEYIEKSIGLLNILKQINCLIDNYHSHEDDGSFYNEYMELPKLIIDWMIVNYMKAEIDSVENVLYK